MSNVKKKHKRNQRTVLMGQLTQRSRDFDMCVLIQVWTILLSSFVNTYRGDAYIQYST